MPEYAQLARALQNVMHEVGLDIIVASTENSPDAYNEILNRQIEANVFGLILVPPLGGALPLDLIMQIQKKEIPVVTCYRHLNNTGWPSVMNDVYHTAYACTNHLLEVGCKKIVSFDWNAAGVLNEFHYGYLKALVDSDLPDKQDSSIHSERTHRDPALWPESHEVSRKSIEQLFEQFPDVDGVCCSHDCIAAEVIRYAREKGKDVPRDIAVTGVGRKGV
jgi:DNA-binding LacI/PurR family transcriptional regulator